MGELAMQMSLTWLRDVASGRPAAPAVITGRHYRVALRESALRARGVTLPSIYVEAARLDRSNYPERRRLAATCTGPAAIVIAESATPMTAGTCAAIGGAARNCPVC
jgi:hypothetical protein